MYVKRFRSATVSEALALARQELGEDALLLGTGKPSDDPTGLQVEVTVAAERPRPMGPPRSKLSQGVASSAASSAAAAAARAGAGGVARRANAVAPQEPPLAPHSPRPVRPTEAASALSA